MFYTTFEKRIAQEKNITGLYIFCGTSPGNKLKCIQRMEKKFSSSPEFTTFCLDEKNISADTVLAHIDSCALFSTFKIVIIQLSSTGHNEFLKKIAAHYEQKQLSSDVLLIIDVDKIPKTKVFETFFLKKARMVVEFDLKKEGDVKQWIQQAFTEQKKRIDRDSLDIMYERFGNNLEILSSEIQKLLDAFAGTAKTITAEQTLSVISLGNTPEFFTIIDDMIYRRPECIEKIHQKILYDEQLYEMFAYSRKCIRFLMQAACIIKDTARISPHLKRTLAMGVARSSDYRISNQIRSELKTVKQYVSHYFTGGKDTNILKTHPFQMQKFFCAASQFTLEEIKKIHLNSVELDRKHKSGNIDLKTAVTQIMCSVVYAL